MNAENFVASSLHSSIKKILEENESTDVVITNISGRIYVVIKELGFSLVSDDSHTVTCVQVHGDRCGYGPASLLLPKGVAISDAKTDIHKKLGLPIQVGGGGFNPLDGGTIPPWEIFLLGKYKYHFEYAMTGGGISLVSIELATSPQRCAR